jgi:hypothetical protein
VVQNFVNEIEYLLSQIPAEQWADLSANGLCYEFLPWHEWSAITLQTRDDPLNDVAAWKYYTSAESDGSRVAAESATWKTKPNRLLYHRLLIEAAEALLRVDLTRYVPKLVTGDEFSPYRLFQVQVYDVDKTFEFNYCEYVLARRLEPA